MKNGIYIMTGTHGTAAQKSARGADIVMSIGRMKCMAVLFPAPFAEKQEILIYR